MGNAGFSEGCHRKGGGKRVFRQTEKRFRFRVQSKEMGASFQARIHRRGRRTPIGDLLHVAPEGRYVEDMLSTRTKGRRQEIQNQEEAPFFREREDYSAASLLCSKENMVSLSLSRFATRSRFWESLLSKQAASLLERSCRATLHVYIVLYYLLRQGLPRKFSPLMRAPAFWRSLSKPALPRGDFAAARRRSPCEEMAPPRVSLGMSRREILGVDSNGEIQQIERDGCGTFTRGARSGFCPCCALPFLRPGYDV